MGEPSTTEPASPTSSQPGGAQTSEARGEQGRTQPEEKNQESQTRFASSTIEIVLQFLPGDREGDRRIRTVLNVSGKVLKIGSLRTTTLSPLVSSLAGLSPEQLLERLSQYVAESQQQSDALQKTLTKQPTALPRSSPAPAPGTQSPQFPAPTQASSSARLVGPKPSAPPAAPPTSTPDRQQTSSLPPSPEDVPLQLNLF